MKARWKIYWLLQKHLRRCRATICHNVAKKLDILWVLGLKKEE